MDASYLKKNVAEALSEALTSMAIIVPDDKIEYIGKFLINYVDRKNNKIIVKDDLNHLELELSEYLSIEEEKNKAVEAMKFEKQQFENNYNKFLHSITDDIVSHSKETVMNSICHFMETSLRLPAAYIAIKKVVGETETLNYTTVGPSQQHIHGKKLFKVITEDGDESVSRQGISFDAFKLPEVPESEEGEEDGSGEDGTSITPKVIPKAQPLVIENVMREKRCKFFGIPKLGAYVAVPFTYKSTEYEEGVTLGIKATEETTANIDDNNGSVDPSSLSPPIEEFVLTPKDVQFIIAFDSIGNYRRFSSDEIQKVILIGNELVKYLELKEKYIAEKHIKYLKSDSYKAVLSAVSADFVTKLTESEAPVIAKVGEDLAAEAAAKAAKADPDAEPLPTSESEKPFKEASAVLEKVWNINIGNSSLIIEGIHNLNGYLLPPSSYIINLFYAIGCLIMLPPTSLQNVCGDPDWNSIRNNLLNILPSKILDYNPSKQYLIKPMKQNLLVSIKAFAEINGILDASVYPPTMTLCSQVLLLWLQKAMIARESAIVFHLENKIILE